MKKILLVVVPLLLAVAIIYFISQGEINRYSNLSDSIFEVEAIYDEVSLERVTIYETIVADYKVVSDKTEMYSCQGCVSFIPYVSEGDEVFSGNTLFFADKKEYTTKINGIISYIDHNSGSIFIERFDSLTLEVDIPKEHILNTNNEYESSLGDNLVLTHHSNIVKDGKRKHYFRYSGKLIYNDEGKVSIYTSRKVEDQYAIPNNCLVTIDDKIYAKLIGENQEAEIVELQIGMKDEFYSALLNVGDEFISCDLKYANKYRNVEEAEDE